MSTPGEPEIEYYMGDLFYANPPETAESLAKMQARREAYNEVYTRLIASGALVLRTDWLGLHTSPPLETHDYEFHNDYGQPDPNTVQAGDDLFRCQ